MTNQDQLKKMGWLCPYTPLEIPLAAGMTPIRLEGGDSLSKSQDPRIYQLMCPYVRAIFNKAAEGGFPPLDAVVFTNGCDALNRLYDLWKAYLSPKNLFFLEVPKIQTEAAISFYESGLREWARQIEAAFGRRIQEGDLEQAIASMNRLRMCYQELSGLRRKRPGTMSFEAFHGLTRKALEVEPEEGLALLREALSRIRDGGAEAEADHRPRIFLMSTMFDQPGIVRMIEEAGLAVTSEDYCLGARHFEDLVSETGDPYRALAERYLLKWPCPRMKGTDRRFERLGEAMDRDRTNGVIFVWLKYCDQSGFEIPLLKEFLKKRGLPLLVVENDYTEGGLGQLRVRIEAFSEIIKGEI